MMQSTINTSALWAVLLTVGYTAGVSLSPVFQPAFYTFIVLYPIVFTKFSLNIRDKHLIMGFICFIACLTLITMQALFLQIDYVRAVVRFSLPILFFCILVIIYHDVPKDAKSTFFTKFLKYLFIAMLLDTLYRISMNISSFNGLLSSRYVFKNGGLIFYDSNFSGFFCGLCCLISKNRISKGLRLGFLFLSIISFSLAVYMALIFSTIGILFSRSLPRTTFIALFLIFLFIVLSYLNTMFGLDGSFDTKLDMIGNFFRYFDTITLQKLIGIGFGNYQDAMNSRHSAHNILTQFIEGGLLYMLIICVLYATLLGSQRNYYQALPYLLLIAVFSLYPTIYASLILFILFINAKTDSDKHCVLPK